jgi:glutamine synthetase
MAVIDGINNKIDPGNPTDVNTYDLPHHRKKQKKFPPFQVPLKHQ